MRDTRRVAIIGPDSTGPDLQALIRILRQAMAAAPAAATTAPATGSARPAPGATAPAAGTGSSGPGSLTGPAAAAAGRAARADPLAALFADGPSPGAQPVLPALQRLLRDSLARTGGVEQLVRQLVSELATPPATAGPGRPGAAPPASPTAPSVPPAVPLTPSAAPPTTADLRLLLPSGPAAQSEALARALTWLVDNLDRPHVVTAGLAQLGPAAAALGIPPERMELLAVLLSDAMRASGWRPEQRAAWQTVGRLAGRWAAQGAAAAAYEPPTWLGTVIGHELRRQDLAVLLVRTYLPYPYLAGQHAVVETGHHRETWRACWLATPPPADNVVELHVRAGPADPVGMALVGRVGVGDLLRLRPAEGPLVLDPVGETDLLLVAEDTGVAPMKALLGELWLCGDPRAVQLLWLAAPNEEPYDLPALSMFAGGTATVEVLPGIAELLPALEAGGPWSDRDVFVAGTPTTVAGALTALAYAGIPANRIRCDQIGPDD